MARIANITGFKNNNNNNNNKNITTYTQKHSCTQRKQFFLSVSMMNNLQQVQTRENLALKIF